MVASSDSGRGDLSTAAFCETIFFQRMDETSLKLRLYLPMVHLVNKQEGLSSGCVQELEKDRIPFANCSLKLWFQSLARKPD